ncbi:MAG: DNA topoisomerase VI subunit B [Phycisphaerales bacterium]|nr:DNA topoisomerase VI subunit B [Phycisphaerales bacterium]
MSAVAELEPPTTHVSKKSTSGTGREKKVTAETMASRQRDISVSEFFAKNRHLLGFDNPRKALLTTVKEAVDNSLDACEEASILPDITVVIEDLQPERGREVKQSRYRITVVDNGPGIVRKQVENIFGRLLYGSKFHRLKMSRGQQGIGISAAGMYGLITTGKPMMIQTRPDANKKAHHIELAMNTKTNRAEVTVDEETPDFPLQRLRGLTAGTREMSEKGEFLSPKAYPTGTSVTIELEGRYQKGRGSVDEFLELTAIANPHARITFVPPSRESAAEEEDVPLLKGGKRRAEGGTKEGEVAAGGEAAEAPAVVAPAAPVVTTETNGIILFPRAVEELPPETKEIMPHPRGIELGILLQMLKEAEQEEKGYTLYNFLQDKFSRVSANTAGEFCKSVGLTSRTKVGDVDHATAEKLYKEMQESKLPPPPTDCLAPIGVRQLLAGLLKGVRAEFYAASSREAAVYRGRPFLIEAAIAFGGELPTEDSSRVIRFANRVPLLFQQSACSSFKAVGETNWRNYDLQQPRGAAPVGPIVIMIHMASVWVPFTSESKEAVADYDEIRKEMKLALMECGRKLGAYMRKRLKMRREAERRDVFERYIGEISKAVNAINGTDTRKLFDALLAQAKKRTAIADLRLDEDGKKVKEEDPADQEGVIIVGVPNAGTAEPAGGRQAAEPASPSRKRAPGKPDPFAQSKAEAAMLRVAARAKADDDEPTLMDVKQARRAPSKPEKPRPARPAASKKPAAIPAAPPPAAAPIERKPKPKMRLDLRTGKPVPLDDAGGRLF